MVNNEGQLYTIEGVAAAVLLVVTAYIILNSTILFTPSDTHINDMQLEQLGNDVLRMMDTRDIYDNTNPNAPIYDKKQSPLENEIKSYILNSDEASKNEFETTFLSYANENPQKLKLYSTIYRSDGSSIPFSSSMRPSNREHVVTVTRWVNIEDEVVLLEVMLWRD